MLRCLMDSMQQAGRLVAEFSFIVTVKWLWLCNTPLAARKTNNRAGRSSTVLVEILSRYVSVEICRLPGAGIALG
jgi:hypothetical protein